MKDKQEILAAWARMCFGDQAVVNLEERTLRFLEEALELTQAIGRVDRAAAHKMVDYVYDRERGRTSQEIAGVGVTLLILCDQLDIDFEEALNAETVRVILNADKCRAKHAAKPEGIRTA